MPTYVVLMLAFSGITALAALIRVWRPSVSALGFYWLAAAAMGAPFGAAVAAGSWFAILPGFLGAVWIMAGQAEISRVDREKALALALRATRQGEAPR